MLNSRIAVYRNLLNQREQLRLEAQSTGPELEVVNYASAGDAKPAGLGLRQRIGLAAGAGLVVFVFLAFVLEFLQRNRNTGRMEPVLKELRGDWLFGWMMRKKD